MSEQNTTASGLVPDSKAIKQRNIDQNTADLIDMAAEQYASLILEIYQAREQKRDSQRRKRKIESKRLPWRSF